MGGSETDELEYYIRTLDNKYLDWLAKKRETASASARRK